MGKMLRVIRPCHRVMVPGARQNLHRLQRQGWDVGVLQLSTPQLSWGWAPGRTSRTQHSKCMPPVPSVPPCCDGDHAEQGESTRPNESPDKVLGHRRVVRQGEAAAPHPLQPPSCLPMGCRVATNASHHTAGSLLAQEGSVRWDGEPEPCGVRGAGNLLWCVPASAEPKQETTAAGDCCGQRAPAQHRGLAQHRSSVVATPTVQKIQLVTGKQDRPMQALQPHSGTPRKAAADTAPAVPGAAEAGGSSP